MVIESYEGTLDFGSRDEYMISPRAWRRIEEIGVEQKLVFAHPDILQAHPETSLYYRGMSLLSRKRVADAACQVTEWETGKRKGPIPRDRALRGCATLQLDNQLNY